MIKYIFFDLDGTITNPGEGITNSVAYALEKFHIYEPDHTRLYPFIGPPLKDSFKRFYGFDDEKAGLGLTYYREYYGVKGIFECELYDGIKELLKELYDSGYVIVLATSKPDEYARKILEHFDVLKYFTFVGGADMSETRVTKSDVIAHIFENIDIPDKNKVIMVGDREYDVKGAAEYGIKTIGVLYGYGNREELVGAGAAYIAHEPKDVLDRIQNLSD